MGRGMVKPRKSITMRATVPYCTNVVTRSNRVSGFRDPTWCRVTRPFPPSKHFTKRRVAATTLTRGPGTAADSRLDGRNRAAERSEHRISGWNGRLAPRWASAEPQGREDRVFLAVRTVHPNPDPQRWEDGEVWKSPGPLPGARRL